MSTAAASFFSKEENQAILRRFAVTLDLFIQSNQ
jgi:hypothetical protein